VALALLAVSVSGTAATAKIRLLDKATAKMESLVEQYQPVEKSAQTVKDFVAEIAVALPVLHELGFEVDSFRTQLLPPKVQIRIVSRNTTKLSRAGLSTTFGLPDDASVISKSIVVSAKSARELQQMMQLSGIVMDIGLGLKPSIKMSFLTQDKNVASAGTRFDDLDLLCGAAFD
jgi:hypothetical protein